MTLKPLFMSLLALACFYLSACSISSAGHHFLGGGDAAPVTSPLPDLPEEPTAPPVTQEPVVVSEPIPAVPPNSPNPPVEEVTPTPEPTAEPVLATPTLEEMEPVTVIEETPTTPAVVVIDNSQIINIEVPTPSPAPMAAPIPEPSPESEPAPTIPEPEPVATSPSPAPNPIPVAVEEPVPQELLDVINDVINPTDLVDEVDETPEADEANFTPEDNKISEITTEGACLGKKKVAIIWYSSKNPKKKKGKSVRCHKDRFKLRIKEKKGRIRFILIQTVFYSS